MNRRIQIRGRFAPTSILPNKPLPQFFVAHEAQVFLSELRIEYFADVQADYTLNVILLFRHQLALHVI